MDAEDTVSKHLKGDIPGLIPERLMGVAFVLWKTHIFKQTWLKETLPAPTKLDRNIAKGKKPLDAQTTISRNQARKTILFLWKRQRGSDRSPGS